MQNYEARTYHETSIGNLPSIMTEGLKPLAKYRPKEIEVVDVAFDAIADSLGINHRRKGLFAWPNNNKAYRCNNTASRIIEVMTDPCDALVLHQAWMDLGWGIVEGIFGRVPKERQNEIRQYSASVLLEDIGTLYISCEGFVSDVLSELGEHYWKTGVRLAEYNEETSIKMIQQVVDIQKKKFSGLMSGLDHEVAIGTQIIMPDRLKVLD